VNGQPAPVYLLRRNLSPQIVEGSVPPAGVADPSIPSAEPASRDLPEKGSLLTPVSTLPGEGAPPVRRPFTLIRPCVICGRPGIGRYCGEQHFRDDEGPDDYGPDAA